MKLKGRRKVQPVQNGKQLYHIQAVAPEDWVEEILELYEVYSVYAEEV